MHISISIILNLDCCVFVCVCVFVCMFVCPDCINLIGQ